MAARSLMMILLLMCVAAMYLIFHGRQILLQQDSNLRHRSLLVRHKHLPLLHKVQKDLTFWPRPQSMKTDMILPPKWVKDVERISHEWKHKSQITLLLANSAVIDMLLNWLILATSVNSFVNLDSVLVIAMDQPVCKLMQEKRIKSVLVSPQEWLNNKIRFQSIRGLTRLSVARVLSYMGYDTLIYDLDALPLKDIQPFFNLYPDSEIVGSMGIFPVPLRKKWNKAHTLCTGVILIRSTEKTEFLWKKVHEDGSTMFYVTDQKILNYALDSMQITWRVDQDSGFQEGITSPEDLHVTIIPNSKICRLHNCDPKMVGNYFVWHKGGNSTAKKLEDTKRISMWYLSDDWIDKNECFELETEEWLKCLTEEYLLAEG